MTNLQETKNYNLLPYKIDNNNTIEVTQIEDDVWLTQKQMAQLFSVDKSRISRHLQNFIKKSELDNNSVTEEISTTAKDGKQYNMSYYNLDAIIYVGCRVNSKREILFRQWATKIIKEKLKNEYSKRNFTAQKSEPKRIATTKEEDIRKIKNLLLGKELTQKQIASDLGVLYEAVYNIIYGKTHNPSILKHIKEILGVNEEGNKLFEKAKVFLKNTLNGDENSFNKLKNLLNSVAVTYEFDNLEELC